MVMHAGDMRKISLKIKNNNKKKIDSKWQSNSN